jgi:hypothetical protein
MESNATGRSGLLTAGGILTILAGTLQIIGGVLLVAFFNAVVWQWPMESEPGLWAEGVGRLSAVAPCSLPTPPVWSTPPVVGSLLIIIGIVAIAGGVSAIRRRSFGLSLAGAICALPSAILGWYLVVIASTVLPDVDVFPLAAMAICGLALVVLGILAVVFVSVSKSGFGAQGKEIDTGGRGKLLTTGGVLSIIGGSLEMVGGGIMVGLVIAHREMFRGLSPGSYPGIYSSLFGGRVDLIWLLNVGVPLLLLGMVGIVGGIWAIQRRGFGLSLAGAVCALASVIFTFYLGFAAGVGINAGLASLSLGILAVVFVALGRREFRAKVEEDGVQ